MAIQVRFQGHDTMTAEDFSEVVQTAENFTIAGMTRAWHNLCEQQGDPSEYVVVSSYQGKRTIGLILTCSLGHGEFMVAVTASLGG